MPKKKTQHKRQNKVLQTEESFNEENIKIKGTEAYETIVDFDQSGKFSKRRLESNWAKYEVPLTDFECDVTDEKNTGMYDYNYLVENASSDFSHFQFASEKSWKETKPIVNNRIFKLDLNILSNGLACIPFYERIGLDKEKISDEDKKRCDEEAEKNWKKYQVIRENFNKNNLVENKIKKNDKEENLELSSLKLNPDFKKNFSDFTFFPKKNLQTSEADEMSPELENVRDVEYHQKPKVKEKKLEDWLDKALLLSDDKVLNKDKSEEKKEQQKEFTKKESIKKQKSKEETQKVIFSDNGENLEDWLDSVLDD